MTIPQRGGLPHSDIHGSTPARGSPWLFAACHVLHRLLVPRHPPNALLSLEITSPGIDPEASTMHRNHPQRPTTIPVSRAKRQLRASGSLSLSTQQSPLNTIAIAGTPETSGQTLRWQRPETHQNLIHPDKERRPHLETPPASQFHPGAVQGQNHQCRSLSLLRDTIRSSPAPNPKPKAWWR